MKISIIGTGYVGLVTGVCFADKGHDVTCVDIDEKKVEQINRGVPTIFEVGLEDLLRKNVGERFRATCNCRQAVLESDMTLIAVGTPFDGQEIDLRFVKAVAAELGEILRDKDEFHVVVVKSTVVPGTTTDVVLPILEASSGKVAGKDFGVGTNPEFLSEGTAVVDFMNPDRIVLGGSDPRTLSVLEDAYESFAGVERIKTNNKTAEMIKYASNSLLATMISFANEFGNLCSSLGGVDAVDVMHGVHLSQYLAPRHSDGSRVTAPITSFLKAGCGFGGSCLPKDVNALIRHGEKCGQDMPLLKAVMRINDEQPQRMLSLLKRHFASLQDLRVSVLGLAFKPGTDDMRLSPAIPLVQQLLNDGACISAYDPVANEAARDVFGDAPIQYRNSLGDAVADADAVMLVTQWEEFAQLADLVADRTPQPVCIDGRRVIDPSRFTNYEGIGV